MTNANSTLLAHVDCNKVTRHELALMPTPEATSSWKPIPHIQLIETMQAQLLRHSIMIEKESFAVRADGSRLFGTLDLSINGMSDGCASLGFRTSNDKSLAIQIVAGMRVFVCDNLVLSGDFIALKRKHTSGLELPAEIWEAITRYMMHYQTLKTLVTGLKGQSITDGKAKEFIHDAFTAETVMPIRFLPAVSKAYFEPLHVEFEARNLWSLHNAFTEVAKEMPLNTRLVATQEVGRFFGLATAV